jgi:hypothetical protein
MCGAMKNDAFDLPEWSLDQALLWIATRNPVWITDGYSWDEFVLWISDCDDDEQPQFPPGSSPYDAKPALLRALQKGQVTGWDGVEPVEPRWFNRATYLPKGDKTLIENKHITSVEVIAITKEDHRHQRRIWTIIDLRLDPAQVLACFPAQEQVTTLLEQQDHVDGSGSETSQAQGTTDTDTDTRSKKRRKRGAVSLQSDDAPLVAEMHRLITAREARSVSAAAGMVVNLAKGHGSEESKLRRLRERYADQYDPDELE